MVSVALDKAISSPAKNRRGAAFPGALSPSSARNILSYVAPAGVNEADTSPQMHQHCRRACKPDTVAIEHKSNEIPAASEDKNNRSR
jgi:hypothetical protein